jgi:hypothetical protein
MKVHFLIKNLIFTFSLLFLFSSVSHANNIKPVFEDKKSNLILKKNISIKNVMPISYKLKPQTEFCYILFTDGCFHLCAIQTTIIGIFEIEQITPVNRYTYPGMHFMQLTFCPYTMEEMATMC